MADCNLFFQKRIQDIPWRQPRIDNYRDEGCHRDFVKESRLA